jgi:hypothetical protein
MEADINGTQQKVVSCLVAPVRRAHGNEGIVVRDGKTLPFSVTREWSAPAGHYEERWYLVNPESREVLYEAPARDVLIWGLQALTDVTDRCTEPIPLPAGQYSIIFALGGLMGGEWEIEVSEAPSEEAA